MASDDRVTKWLLADSFVRIEAAMYESRIIYEDNDLLVCHKPAGIATQTARIGQADMVSEMENYLAGNSVRGSRRGSASRLPHIYLVHRLDQPVEGILVFAKQQAAAAGLCAQAAGEELEKEYLALICDLRGGERAGGLHSDGRAAERIQGGGQAAEQMREGQRVRSGVLTDYLLKDGKTNRSRVVPPEIKGAKEARLSYEVLRDVAPEDLLAAKRDGGRVFGEDEEGGGAKESGLHCAVVKIRLYTGRHHQIRVQMANAGMPLLGDRKYADHTAAELSENLGIREIALCAYRLSFCHPRTGERLHFEIVPEGSAFRGIRS